jgi:hypothetical protein
MSRTRRSICPSIPSPELCGAPLCKWNVKLGRCRKAATKRAAAPRPYQAKLHNIAAVIDPEYDDSFSDTFSVQARENMQNPAEIPEDKYAQERAEAYVNVKKHGCRVGDLLFIGCYAQRQENGFAIVLPHATRRNKLVVKALGDDLAWGILPFKDILNARRVKYDALFVHSRDAMRLFHDAFLGKAYSMQDEFYPLFLDHNLLSASAQLDWSPYH